MARTPMHYAAGNGHTKVVEALLAAGADVNVLTLGEETPLMKAVFFMKNETVRCLLESGANIFCQDITGKTATSYARMVGSQELVNCLETIANESM